MEHGASLFILYAFRVSIAYVLEHQQPWFTLYVAYDRGLEVLLMRQLESMLLSTAAFARQRIVRFAAYLDGLCLHASRPAAWHWNASGKAVKCHRISASTISLHSDGRHQGITGEAGFVSKRVDRGVAIKWLFRLVTIAFHIMKSNARNAAAYRITISMSQRRCFMQALTER